MSFNKPLLFATHNKYKVQEVRAIFGNTLPIASLMDIGFNEELPETHNTLKENALEKAEFVFSKTGKNCFAEDTGLEIAALNGEPGVRTARYAGEGKNNIDNIKLVLAKMQGKTNRTAIFRTVIAFVEKGKPSFFEGKIYGSISLEISGKNGFGYDPVFIPDGFDKTFAELDSPVKNTISHRAKAFKAFQSYLHKFNYV
jgi:XTP/dITP diphosphohydrolase